MQVQRCFYLVVVGRKVYVLKFPVEVSGVFSFFVWGDLKLFLFGILSIS